MTAPKVYWRPGAKVWHVFASCGLHREQDACGPRCDAAAENRESDLAVIAVPKLREQGMRLCSACQAASR